MLLVDAVRQYEAALAGIEAAKDAAARSVAEARARADAARAALAGAIVAAAEAGVRQRDIAETTGYSRERVRQICRAAGIEPD